VTICLVASRVGRCYRQPMHSRRTAIQGIAALAAGLALPAGKASAQPTWRKPPRLRPGDTVGLIEPAGFTDDQFDLALVKEAITAMGLVPKPAPHLMARYGYLAGKDRERAADVNAMYADDKIRALFAVRGGWGSARILPYLNFDTIRANPKLLIGFSDITALHMAIAARAGFTTIHGPNAASAWGALSLNSLRSLAFAGETPTYSSPAGTEDRLVQRAGRTRTFRAGKATGRLLGGNLTVLTALMGTPYLPDFSGAILFLEDVDEAEYRIDRMLTQLALGGVLRRVAGVVFGQCTDCRGRGPSYGGFTLSEVLQQHLEPLGVPAFQGALIGHVPNQFSIPVGIRAEIDASAGTIRILEPAVA
jgi:muramoyltetrapeptide carboxypeptidase